MINTNEYFDGKVKSLGYQSADGKSTVGVMEPGEYEFGTVTQETMIIIEGALEVLLPAESNWRLFQKNESFEVTANVSFKVRSEGQTAYLCRYK